MEVKHRPITEVGLAPVDSGQMMICDMSFIDRLYNDNKADYPVNGVDSVIVEVEIGDYDIGVMLESQDGRVAGVALEGEGYPLRGGVLKVPTGRVVFIDPCYVFDDDRYEGTLYQDVCDITCSKRGYGIGMDGNIFVSGTGYGDGAYPVSNYMGLTAISFIYLQYADCEKCGAEERLDYMDGDGHCQYCWVSGYEDEDEDF